MTSNKDVYKHHITPFFGKNDIINVIEGFVIEDSSMRDISNNMEHIKNTINQITNNMPKNKEINENVNKNYVKMRNEVSRYNMRNQKMIFQPELYERIDNNGNLYEDLEPSISDARSTDSRELMIQQNTAYIVCSLVISSILIIAITVQ